MKLLVNKSAKKLLMQLVFIFIFGIIISQVFVYLNALSYKHGMIVHDYKIAGYLSQNPELSSEIQAAFTQDKLPYHMEKGRELLQQAGYKNNIQLLLIPQVNNYYKTNSLLYFIFFIFLFLIVLLAVYLFLKNHNKQINHYNNEINRIMDGDISVRLNDTEEDSFSKLAASINMMTASLYTHIEKEKENRVFLKDILTNVSHQLKTPLSALTMYIEIMRDEEIDNDEKVRFLNKSQNELERMQTLIANLLKLAKLDAGIIELERSNCIINDIIEQIYESFEARLAKEKIHHTYLLPNL